MGRSLAPASAPEPVVKGRMCRVTEQDSWHPPKGSVQSRRMHASVYTHESPQTLMVDTQIPKKKKRKRNVNLTHPT